MSEIRTTGLGYRFSTSVGGTLMGHGGILILSDDPMKPCRATSEMKRAAVSQWYDSTLVSRLDNKSKDAIVLIMRRRQVD